MSTINLRHLLRINLMKRGTSIRSISDSLQNSTPPKTPPISQPDPEPSQSKTLTLSKKPRKSLTQTFNSDPDPLIPTQFPKWVPLNLPKSELFLPLTFPTGQTFRWRQTGEFQYTGVVKSHLVSLKHLDDGDVAYQFHNVGHEDEAKLALLDFLNVGICLADLWEDFSASDERFRDLARKLGGGARVLRQDPVECLIQFLCSSNNNISRITKMVDYISSLGKSLGNVEGFEFYEFPCLKRLALLTEDELRKAGFGYRAKYIIGTVKELESKPGGGEEWLSSLRLVDLEEAIGALCSLPGVGPKVAACIALFSLDQHRAIPVDTHVWKIATRYLIPELAGVNLTAKLHGRVAEAFVTRYGKYAGWAQTLLFIAELPSQKAIISDEVKKTNGKRGHKMS